MADLNALIAQGAQFKAPPDPFAQYAQMQQLQQGQQANQLNQMQMQKYQQEMQSQNALRASAAPAGVNPQHWAIDPQKALALQKTSAEAANLVSTGKKTEGDIRKQLMDFENNAKRDLSQNPSPENIQAYGQDAVLKGFATPEQAAAKVQQYLSMPPDQLVRMLSQAGATAGELLTSESAKLGRATTERGQDIGASTAKAGRESVAATAKAGQGITLRGQNLTNQRAIETLAQGKIPTGYRAVAGGGVEPIPGGPASGDKPLTESQGNATAYGMRMQEANKTLTDLEKRGETDTGVISGVVGGVANMVPLIGDKLQGATGSLFNALPGIIGGLSADQQQVVQSRINFITAQLRKESGASIAPSEFATAENLYFPKPGDTQAVIDAKAKTRKTAIEAMKVQAGPGAKHISTGVGSTTATDPLGLR